MAPNRLRVTWFVFVCFLAIFAHTEARPWRPENIPNGFVNSCQNCHEDPNGGGAGNVFGNQIYLSRSIFLDPPDYFGVVVWGPALAALDADGDGFTNGEELGDPQGLWVPNGAPPLVVNPSFVSNPGDRLSIPPIRPTVPPASGNTEEPDPEPPAAEPVLVELEGLLVEGESTVLNSRFIEVAQVWLFEIQISDSTAYRGLQGEVISAVDVDFGDEVIVSGVQLSSSVVSADTLRLTDLEPFTPENHSADFNRSGWVDFNDFLDFAMFYGTVFGQPGFNFKYDLILDGRIDFNDFLDFVGKFDKPPEGTPLGS